MLNRSASLGMSTSVLKALPGKLDIKEVLGPVHEISVLTASASSKGSGETAHTQSRDIDENSDQNLDL